MLYDEALALYETRERELGEPVLRQVERQVMLRIIDQRWRQHLREWTCCARAFTFGRWARRIPPPSGNVRLRDVRHDDDRHRQRLRQVRHARPGLRRLATQPGSRRLRT